MRILVVEFRDRTHPEAGGAEVILHEVYGRLARRGHAVDYLCSAYAGAAREETLDGMRVVRIANQWIFNYAALSACRGRLRRDRYDVIVENIDKLPFLLPLAARETPVAVSIPHLFGRAVFQEARAPVALYVYLFEKLIPRVYRGSLFAALSESTRADLVRRGIAPGRIRVIPPGLDLDRYRPGPARTAANRDRPRVVYLGRVKRYKGVQAGVEAVARLRARFPDIEYQVIGEGDYAAALRRLAGTLGVSSHVTFTGHRDGGEKTRLLQQADVLVYPSPKEGWGLSVLEANACGVPVVASDSPGLRDAVVDGVTGFLVPHGDAAALARRVGDLLGDGPLHARMREAALARAARFSWDRAADETERWLRAAARGPGPSAPSP